MATKLPQLPFDGQVFIDTNRIKWKWSNILQTWCRIGQANTIPLATESSNGLFASRDKVLLDSIAEAGGGFGLIISPQMMSISQDNPTGVIRGDIVLCSDSIDINCVNSLGDSVECDFSAPDDVSSIPGFKLTVSDLFLDTFCVEVFAPPGPRGKIGLTGDDGKDGFNDSPQGDVGEAGDDATEFFTFTDIKVIELEEIYDTAVVAMELNSNNSTLAYTTSKINVPESDEPADQLIATPISRSLYYPLVADNPEDYLTMDDWVVTASSTDPLSNSLDVVIARIPSSTKSGEVQKISKVKLSDIINNITKYYKERLAEFDKAWLAEIKLFIEDKDSKARTILGAMAQRLAECEFDKPIQFCIGIKADECSPVPSVAPEPSPTPDPCTSADVVFLVDVTESTADVLVNMKAQIAQYVNKIKTLAGPEYRLALVSFRDTVSLATPLAIANETAFTSALYALSSSGGNNGPEACNEAVALAINNGAGNWRDGVAKIIILITDAPPGGGDDTYTPGVDDVAATAIANLALDDDIKIGCIQTPSSAASTPPNYFAPETEYVLKIYSNTTGGAFAQSTSSSVSLSISSLLDSICE